MHIDNRHILILGQFLPQACDIDIHAAPREIDVGIESGDLRPVRTVIEGGVLLEVTGDELFGAGLEVEDRAFVANERKLVVKVVNERLDRLGVAEVESAVAACRAAEEEVDRGRTLSSQLEQSSSSSPLVSSTTT